MKLMVLNNASKQQQQSSGKAAGGTEAPAATAKAETTAGAEVRKRFEFVLFSLSIFIQTRPIARKGDRPSKRLKVQV